MNIVRLIDWVCDHWREKDESIWEVRGGRREFSLTGDVLGGDRPGHPPCEQALVPGSLFSVVRGAGHIYRDIYERFWDPARRGFVQHPGAATFDAAALLMPLVRFVSPTDPRWITTLRGIEQELVSDSLVYRYRLGEGFSDGLTGQEGTFSMCSLVLECLSRMGDLPKARFFFEKMLGYANHLGLYGEELGPRAQHLGNFPQAFTHLALISAAYISTGGFLPPATPAEGQATRTKSADVMITGTVVCSNCAAELAGDYCHACGQKRIAEDELYVGHFLRKSADQLAHLDFRTLRSLRALVRPGLLTSEYLAGRRRQYISPLKLYFLCAAIFFLAAPLAGMSLESLTAQDRSGILANVVRQRMQSRGLRVLTSASDSILGSKPSIPWA